MSSVNDAGRIRTPLSQPSWLLFWISVLGLLMAPHLRRVSLPRQPHQPAALARQVRPSWLRATRHLAPTLAEGPISLQPVLLDSFCVSFRLVQGINICVGITERVLNTARRDRNWFTKMNVKMKRALSNLRTPSVRCAGQCILVGFPADSFNIDIFYDVCLG